MNKKLAQEIIAGFQELLDEMDALEMNEALEEINAEFEDAIFMLESIDTSDEDAQEEFEDGIDELEALIDDYRDLAEEDEALAEMVTKLEHCLARAQSKLNPDSKVIRISFGKN